MGFTIEDMLLIGKDKYRMRLQAGKKGWSNSISWMMLLEDRMIIRNFSGKEVAVTTGLGFQSEDSLMALVNDLVTFHAAGVIINTGFYIHDVPEKVLLFCDKNDLPLITVPWDVYLADMIKDMSIRIFLQGTTDEQISQAFIRAIEAPGDRKQYADTLLPHFSLDGTFQAVTLTRSDLDKMDTVERRRVGYQLQLNLTNLTHNGHFFYYDGAFIIIMNEVSLKESEDIIYSFAENIQRRMYQNLFCLGVGSRVSDIENLHVSYDRAREASRMAMAQQKQICVFDQMGIYRLLYSVRDQALLREMCDGCLAPLIEYDKKHNGQYVETLENYLKYDGSIQKISDAMFIHRNTISYRMQNIRQLLDCPLETAEEKLPYQIACLLRHMKTD